MYVIKRTDQGGGFVAISGHQHSYTTTKAHIRLFDTLAEAQANLCPDNEVILESWDKFIMPRLLDDPNSWQPVS